MIRFYFHFRNDPVERFLDIPEALAAEFKTILTRNWCVQARQARTGVVVEDRIDLTAETP